MATRGAPFTILTVCTGNICRSPAAERLLAEELGGSVEVSSAGSGAVVGHPIDANMAWLMRRDGYRADGFAARQLTEALVRSADLVLALTREHRALIVDLAPAAVRRTFTLTEFAAIVRDLPAIDLSLLTSAERLRTLAPLAVAARTTSALAPEAMDIPDPFGGTEEDFLRAYGLVKEAVHTIAASAGPRDDPHAGGEA